MTPDALLYALPPTRREIMMHLKTQGDASVDDLAGALSMTASAIRQHIVPLEAEGLVDYIEVGSGPGRRKRRYRLTERGEALFPDHCAELAVACASALEHLDPALLHRLVDEALRSQYRRWLREAQALPGGQTRRRLDVLKRMFAENDFLPVLDESNGTLRLTLLHCPLLGLARASSSVCEAELGILRDTLPEATVSRVAHRPDDSRSCVFEITEGERRRRRPI